MKWVFIAIPILLITGLGYFFIDLYLKTVLIISSFLLLFFKESFRRFRLKEIKKHRYTTQKPYAWQINDEEKIPHPDFETLKKSFTDLITNKNKSLLFIIERVTPEDHQAQLYESMVQDLRKENRLVERFFHRGDYELFWTEGYPKEISADELAAKYANWLPIFCSDGLRLIDSEVESLSEAIFPFYGWKNRILLTNRPALSWSYEEELLSVVFTILPINFSGVKAMPSLINQRPGLHHFHQPDEKSELIIKDDEKQIPQKLEVHFGKELTQWVAATALCSKLDWDLTLKIGKHLFKKHPNLNRHTPLRQLSRLGWFRVGEMPEQVRKQLIDYLPTALQNEIRWLVVEAMEASPPLHPSHAHNSYRMELASHKLMIPGFPQKGLKEEFYELKSMGYLEELGVWENISQESSAIQELLPEPIKQHLFNKGGAFFGWSLKILIPLLFIFSSAFAKVVDIIITKPKSLSVKVIDIMGKSIENVTLNSKFGPMGSYENGQLNLTIPDKYAKEIFDVTIKKEGYFIDTITIQPGDKQISINLLPNFLTIKVLDAADGQSTLKNARVSLLTNAKSTASIPIDKDGFATLDLLNKYVAKDSFDILIEKGGYISKKVSFQYLNNQKMVYLNKMVVEEKVKRYKFSRLVTNQCGFPVRDALVKITGFSSKRTDRNGKVQIAFKTKPSKGTIEVRIKKDNDRYTTFNKYLNLDDLKLDTPLNLKQKSIVVNLINAQNGNQITPGIEVPINDSETQQTNRQGKYSFSFNDDEKCKIKVKIEYKNYDSVIETYTVRKEKLDIKLTPKIKKPEVKPLVGEVINIRDGKIEEATIFYKGKKIIVTDSDGTFQIPQKILTEMNSLLEANRQAAITISKDGYLDAKGFFTKRNRDIQITTYPDNFTIQVNQARQKQKIVLKYGKTALKASTKDEKIYKIQIEKNSRLYNDMIKKLYEGSTKEVMITVALTDEKTEPKYAPLTKEKLLSKEPIMFQF